MRVIKSIAALASLFFFLAAAVEGASTVDVFAWPISAASSQTLAQISYNATHAEVKKYTAPKIPIGDDVVRVGFHHPSGTWSGVATSASNFEPHRNRKVLLHLNIEGELYHIGFRASNVQTSSKSGIGKQELGVEVVQMQQGPTPHLNKPVVLNAEGNVDAKEPEKSFLQKYWWVIAGLLVMQVVMAGGGKE